MPFYGQKGLSRCAKATVARSAPIQPAHRRVVALSKGFRRGSEIGARAPDWNHCAAGAACVQLLQLIQGSAFVRSRCSRSSYIEHNGPADPRIVAGAAELVENGHDPSVPSRLRATVGAQHFDGFTRRIPEITGAAKCHSGQVRRCKGPS